MAPFSIAPGGATIAPVFIGSTPVPDAQGSAAGHGFSNNGLVRAPDGTWWLANGGLSQEGQPANNRRQSLVHLSADFTTKLHEIDLYTLADGAGATGGNNIAPEGIAYDTSDNTLWTCWGMSKVIHVGSILSGGAILGDHITTTCNSVSYDPLSDSVFVLNNVAGTLKKFRCSDGVETFSASVADIVYLDHMTYDAETKLIYVTAGDNNGPDSQVVIIRPSDMRRMNTLTLPIFGGIEQGHIVGGKLFINVNAYYHAPSGATPPINRVEEYNMPPVP